MDRPEALYIIYNSTNGELMSKHYTSICEATDRLNLLKSLYADEYQLIVYRRVMNCDTRTNKRNS